MGEFAPWAFDEEKVLEFKGQWRSQVFCVDESAAVDLEIGTGNGYHFLHSAQQYPNRQLVGLELKYKPLIQTIRRTVRAGSKNARVVRFNAALVQQIFNPGELNHVFIHFPDPWEKLRQQKHRLIQVEFLEQLFALQRPGSWLEFKTDSRDYFDWSVERMKASLYQVERLTYDLHQSEWAKENFVTHFEGLFLKQSLPIHYIRLLRK